MCRSYVCLRARRDGDARARAPHREHEALRRLRGHARRSAAVPARLALARRHLPRRRRRRPRARFCGARVPDAARAACRRRAASRARSRTRSPCDPLQQTDPWNAWSGAGRSASPPRAASGSVSFSFLNDNEFKGSIIILESLEVSRAPSSKSKSQELYS